MGPFTALMTVDHAATEAHVEKRSFVRAAIDTVTGGFAGLRREASDRRLRDQLAEMDDAMLRDIGIADDEIHMIRARDRFTPRAWNSRGVGRGRWDV
jgi:uncharacterized protein YjiS (DUF1127 family)